LIAMMSFLRLMRPIAGSFRKDSKTNPESGRFWFPT
jgi:hypothetical protein